MSTKSILRIYDSYLERLRNKREELAVLQLTGKLEDRLAKEFASCVYEESNRALIALSNVGNRGEQKIDLAILQGDFSKDIRKSNARIIAFVEAKYLRNYHKLCIGNAQDELAGTLKDLERQLWTFRGAEYGGFPVKLSGRRNDIYGLVFASYVRPDNRANEEEVFFARVRKQAAELKFTYTDLKYPWLRRPYERELVVVFKRKFRVSLRVGLWRADRNI